MAIMGCNANRKSQGAPTSPRRFGKSAFFPFWSGSHPGEESVMWMMWGVTVWEVESGKWNGKVDGVEKGKCGSSRRRRGLLAS